MKLVYICSPYAGDIDRNTEQARAYCAAAVAEGVMPIAPHLLFPQFLDDSDPKQREIGLQMGLRLLDRCDELWLCGPKVSRGMAREVTYAIEQGVNVLEVPDAELIPHIMEAKRQLRQKKGVVDLCISTPQI